MNADQLKGKWMQFKGELKQQWGKFIDEDFHQIEGNYDMYVGKAQERYGDIKDELMKWADQQYGDKKDEFMKLAVMWEKRSQSEAMGQKTR